MLSSGNFDAYYVQHPGSALGRSNGQGAAGGEHELDSMLSVGPSRPGPSGRLPSNRLGDNGNSHGDVSGHRNNEPLVLGHHYADFNNSNSIMPHHHIQQQHPHQQLSPQDLSSHASAEMGIPWGAFDGGDNGHSKDAFAHGLGDRSTSPLWDTNFNLPFTVAPPQHDMASLPSQLYGSYGGAPEAQVLGNPVYSESSAALPDDLKAGEGTVKYLLGQYDLNVIGDDSGSGGMKRPTPRNKRRRIVKDRPVSRESQAAQEQEEYAPSAVANHILASSKAQPGALDSEDVSGSASDLLDELGSLDRLEEVASSGYVEASDQGALHHGLDGTEDEPLYVNPKQYSRILKRREVRARMEEKRRRTEEAIRSGRLAIDKLPGGRELAARLGLAAASDDEKSSVRRGSAGTGGAVSVVDDGSGQSGKRTYQHESRHKHAMRRPRGPGGRFLTAEEIKAKEAAEAAESLRSKDSVPGESNLSGGNDTRDDVDETYDLLNLE